MAEQAKDNEGGSMLATVGGFILDKGADFCIAFGGLYLAIWVQSGVDAKKEKEAYVQSLNNFKTELTFNKGQKIETAAIDRTVADLQILSAYYQSEASIFEDFDSPEQAAAVVEQIGEMTDALDAVLKEIEPGAKLDDVFSRTEKLKPIKLAPNYQAQIWTVYLAGGVNVHQANAKDKELSRELGMLYSELASIEARVKDIESYHNDQFLPLFAQITAASEDVEGYWYDDETMEPLADEALLAKLSENQPDVAEAAADLNEQIDDNYVTLQIASQILVQKVDDVVNPETGLVVSVAARIDKVNGMIDAELANFQ